MKNIRINQIGYAPELPKFVALLNNETAILKNEQGEVVSRFEDIDLWFDPASGDQVARIDLGKLPAGTYTLEQGAESRTIRVKETPYRDVFNGMVKGMYYQRCGCELKPEHAGVYTHAACHLGPHRLYSDPDVIVEATGGWHDAGDYGKYIGPGAVAVAHMLYGWKLFPEACGDELNIPESGNGVPDILNECRYELEWMLKMQREDGALYHKLAKKRFAAFIMPEEDKGQEYLIPPTHCATAAHAAAAAMSARFYRAYDEAFADKLLVSAEKAWGWLVANPEFVPYYNAEDVFTGPYGDENCLDEAFWAAAELYAATGKEVYLKALTKLCPRVDVTGLGWREVAGLGAMCCLFELDGKLDADFAAALRKRFLRGADTALDCQKRSGYGTALEPDNYIWGSILPIMNNGILFICAWKLTGCEEYLAAALNQLDYMLGVNALDISFVTGFGETPFMNPHHRPSGADGIVDPVPGLVSGGPNKKSPYSTTAAKLDKEIFPAKFYLDETPSADTNEIAIYWNSPAIFVAACFNALTQK